jgi:uncharacterized membrane protein YcgQ (UPF0703/DUF1980 family)
MKNIILITVISLVIFALAGCGKTSENTNTATTQNTSGKANTAPTKSEEPAAKMLKPADVSPDQAVKVIELVDSIAADKEGWKGKEIVVTGFVNSTSSSGPQQLVTLTNDKAATQSKVVNCIFQGKMPDGVAFQTVEIKGKIRDTRTDSESKTIDLEPCEVKK